MNSVPLISPAVAGQGELDRACATSTADEQSVLSEPGGPKGRFSVHGYLARTLRLTRGQGSRSRRHCVSVAWPPGALNSGGQPSSVARHVGESWLRAIANTLARVPWHHVQTLERVIIDNRPTQHGIAAFDRNSPDDGRDGHSIWLHEHLFRSPNHWARGNHGAYFSYHVEKDGTAIADLPNDHSQFSPVLLHELGHLVMYNVINAGGIALSTPVCARTCADAGDCAFADANREVGCISPYCTPFRFQAGTENWAEQYRFHYQSSTTRALLARAGMNCAAVLAEQDTASSESHAAPWELGLPDIETFHRSHWDSCGGRACKAW